jgi:4-amino-4-deoxy-L-arabinose transferase-like glycosyltransferase
MNSEATHKRPTTAPRAISAPILLILAIAFGLRVFFLPHHPAIFSADEIYQTQEVAHRIAFGPGIVTWEWREGVRSYVVPLALAGLMRATSWMGEGSTGYRTAIALCMALLSLTTVWFCYAWSRRIAGELAGLLAAGTAAIWFFMVIVGARTFSEVFATDCFLPGLLVATRTGTHGDVSRRDTVLAGLLLALTACLRPQLIPVVLFAAIWLSCTTLRSRWRLLLIGAVMPILVYAIVDWVTLSIPFISFVRYFTSNINEGRARSYGVAPWYAYVVQIVHDCWPLLIPALLGLRRSPLLGWLLLVLLGTHSLIGHKEMRYLYLAFPLLSTLFAIGCAEAATLLRLQHGWLRALILAGIFAVVAIISWRDGVAATRNEVGRGTMHYMAAVATDQAICGVGLYRLHWTWTGGYTTLHRNVPLIILSAPQQLFSDATQFNLLLTDRQPFTPPPGFVFAGCDEEACSYSRRSECAPAGPDEVNAYLRRTGN